MTPEPLRWRSRTTSTSSTATELGCLSDLAWGIAAYLNTTAVDMFFRQFNGHTQVNATDLRSLNYPTLGQLETLGAAARESEHTQVAIDALFDRCVPAPAEDR